jgi:hypothetical protein
MTNSREYPLNDLSREQPTDAMASIPEIVRLKTDVDIRHYAPIEAALPNETSGYEWRRETGGIQSYRDGNTGGWLHIDPQTNFYDREAQPTSRESALEHAGHSGIQSVNDNSIGQSPKSDHNDQAISH